MKTIAAFVIVAVTLAAAAPDPGTAARLARAREQIARTPGQADGQITLALALVKAARATGNQQYLLQAEHAIHEALRLSPDNFEAGKARVALHLAEHRYPEALAEAEALNKRVPDDNMLYGYVADAQIALGNYAAAEKAAQWMIDQHPVNAPGLQRGALLREILGFNGPALEWWNSALRITSSADAEERAWILVNRSRVHQRLGKPAEAEKDARHALELVPDYPPAVEALAAALVEQDRPGDAVPLLTARLKNGPDASAQFHLAQALEAAGKPAEAGVAWEQFEKQATVCVDRPLNANHELIHYYATHGQAAAAVELASQEAQGHPDIDTLAVYALALDAAGDHAAASLQMARALAPGIRDVRLFLQAATAAAALPDKPAAARYLKRIMEMNGSSPEAEKAMKLLTN